MIKNNKAKNAFTLAEVVVVFTIIAVVVVARIAILKSQETYTTRYQYYSAFMNLKQMVGSLVADGYTLSGDTTTHKGVPNIWNQAAPDATHSMGMCQRLAKIVNSVGSFSCTTAATTSFNTKTPSFVTTNGMRYFISSAAAVPTYTIYVDINGVKGSGVLYQDVMQFTITTDGIVRPYYKGDSGANDPTYLSASYRYWDSTNKYYVTPTDSNGVAKRGLSYRQAMCESGEAARTPTYTCTAYGAGTNYPAGLAYTKLTPTCNTNVCEVVITPPGL